jgi:hypothetical protein
MELQALRINSLSRDRHRAQPPWPQLGLATEKDLNRLSMSEDAGDILVFIFLRARDRPMAAERIEHQLERGITRDLQTSRRPRTGPIEPLLRISKPSPA